MNKHSISGRTVFWRVPVLGVALALISLCVSPPVQAAGFVSYVLREVAQDQARRAEGAGAGGDGARRAGDRGERYNAVLQELQERVQRTDEGGAPAPRHVPPIAVRQADGARAAVVQDDFSDSDDWSSSSGEEHRFVPGRAVIRRVQALLLNDRDALRPLLTAATARRDRHTDVFQGGPYHVPVLRQVQGMHPRDVAAELRGVVGAALIERRRRANHANSYSSDDDWSSDDDSDPEESGRLRILPGLLASSESSSGGKKWGMFSELSCELQGHILAQASMDRRVCKVGTDEPMKPFTCMQALGPVHDQWISSVSVGHDGKMMVSAGFDGTVKIWRENEGTGLWACAKTYRQEGGGAPCMMHVALSQNGQTFAFGYGQRLTLGQQFTGMELLEGMLDNPGRPAVIRDIQCSSDGNRVAAVFASPGKSLVEIWQRDDATFLMQLQTTIVDDGPDVCIDRICLAPNGRTLGAALAVGMHDRRAMRIFQLGEGGQWRCAQLLERAKGEVQPRHTSAVFAPDGEMLVVTPALGVILLLRQNNITEPWQCMQRLNLGAGCAAVEKMIFNAEGTTLLVGWLSGIQMWQRDEISGVWKSLGLPADDPEEGDLGGGCLGLSQDGQTLVSGLGKRGLVVSRGTLPRIRTVAVQEVLARGYLQQCIACRALRPLVKGYKGHKGYRDDLGLAVFDGWGTANPVLKQTLKNTLSRDECDVIYAMFNMKDRLSPEGRTALRGWCKICDHLKPVPQQAGAPGGS